MNLTSPKYLNDFEYLQDMLCRLDMLLNIQTIKFQAVQSLLYKDIPSNIAITDDEINVLLKNSTKEFEIYFSLEDSNDEIKKLRCAIESKEVEIFEKLKETQTSNLIDKPFLALPYLTDTLNLTQLEVDALIVCLALQIDSQISKKYQRIYGYLNDNLNQKRPTVDLVLALEFSSIPDRLKSRFILNKSSKLFRYQILKFIVNDDNYDTFEQPIMMEERMASFLLGVHSYEHRISSFTTMISANDRQYPNNVSYADNFDLILFEPEMSQKINSLFNLVLENNDQHNNTERLRGVLQSHNLNKKKFVINFYGKKGSGRKSTARLLCNDLGFDLLTIDIAKIISQLGVGEGSLQSMLLQIEESLYLSFREVLLFKCPVYLTNFDQLLEKEKVNEKNSNDDSSSHKIMYSYLIKSITNMIKESSWLTFIETEYSWNHDGEFRDYFFMNIEFKIPGFKTRKMIWKSIAEREMKTSAIQFDDKTDIDFDMLANKFVFTPGKISEAFMFAKNVATIRNFKDVKINMEDLYQSCKIHSSQGLSILARKIKPNYTWNEISDYL